MLKLIEEPTEISFLILLVENKNNVLNTILNRCIIFELEQYTKEELSYFTKGCKNTDLILDVVHSPGKIINSNVDSYIEDLQNLCKTIVSKLDKANYLNTLTIVDKINYKDEYNKFDLFIFIDCLLHNLFEDFIKAKNNTSLKMYLYLNDMRKKLSDKRLNKELFMTNILTNLWRLVRE